MSRGLGTLQRRVLDAFEELGGTASVLTVAEHIHGELVAVGSSRYESARRAIRGLVRRRLIRQYCGRRARERVEWVDGRRAWHSLYGLPAAVEAYARAEHARCIKKYGVEMAGSLERWLGS